MFQTGVRLPGVKDKYCLICISLTRIVRYLNEGHKRGRLRRLGTLGSRSYHTNGSTDIIVYISCKDGINLKKMEKDELLHSFAFITGTVIRYNGRMALQLRNRKDLDFTSTRSSIILK